MINQTIIAGRLVSDPEIEELENGRKASYITVAVPRSYKNVDGIYDTDFIKCTLWDGIAKNAVDFLKKGDIVGIKGILETKDNQLIVIAEKLSYLSSGDNK